MRKNLPKYVVNSFITIHLKLLLSSKRMTSLATHYTKQNHTSTRSVQGTPDFTGKVHPLHYARFLSDIDAELPDLWRKLCSPCQQRGRVKKGASRKAMHSKTTHVRGIKKHRSLSSTSSSSDLPSDELSCQDLASVAKSLRLQVAKWQSSQTTNKLRQLKEHEHFEVGVDFTKDGSICASLTCVPCRRKHSLGQSCVTDCISDSDTWFCINCV